MKASLWDTLCRRRVTPLECGRQCRRATSAKAREHENHDVLMLALGRLPRGRALDSGVRTERGRC
jgi:hypothetical protein